MQKQASPGLAAAGQYMRNFQQFSVRFSRIIVEEDINSTLERICHELSTSSLTETPPTVVIIDISQSGLALSAINLLKEKINIPIVFSSLNDGNFKPEENQLHVLPPNRIISTILRDFILIQKVQGVLPLSLNVIHDETFVFLNLTNCTIYQLAMDKNAIEHKLISIQSWETAIILIGSFSFINAILEVVSEHNIFKTVSTLYAFSPEGELTHLQKPCNSSYSLVILNAEIYNKTRLDELKLQHSELATSPQVDTLFYFHISVASLLASFNFINTSQIKQLISFKNMSTKSSHELLNLIKEKIIFLPSPYGPFYLKNSEIQQNFTIQATKLINKNHCKKNQFSSKIKPSEFEVSSLEKSTTEYRIVVAEFPPFIYEDNSKKPKKFYGYCIDLLNHLSRRLKFNYTLYESTFGNLPEINKNHTWTGVIKELIEKRADLALAPVSVMKERQNVVDLTIPIYDIVGITILLRRPSTASSFFQFLTVLEKKVWGCILAAYFLTSLLLCLFDRLSPYSSQNHKKKHVNDDKDHHEFTLKESLWFCVISLTPLGGGEAPKNVSGKLMVATWWLFGFIVVASYSANLAAYLTVTRHDKSISSLDDLFLQHKIKYAPINGSVAMVYFERMAYIENKFQKLWTEMNVKEFDAEEKARLAVWEYPLSNKYTKLWINMKKTKLPRTFKDGLQRVRDGDFALLAESTELKYESITNCDVMTVGEEFSRKPYALAVQKGSPLKRQLSLEILKLETERVLHDLKQKWWDKNKNRKTCDVQEYGGISIKNNGGVFVVVLIGLGLGGLTLLVEYWRCQYRTTRNKHPARVNVISVRSQRLKYRSAILKKHPQIRPRYTYYYQT
uniref:Ionotropic glutamate receptor C-terminal domain-containing protein n=1 Tax=Strigamia maritima TaxID=126957 RepID=T1IIS9_STRMM